MSVTKEVRLYLLSLAEDIASDLKTLPNEMKHSNEYRATKEIIKTLRTSAANYRDPKLK